MVAVGLLGACRVEVQTSVHVDNAGPKGSHGNVTRMREHIVPGREGRRRHRIRCDLESTKSTAQQVDSRYGNGQKQNGNRARQEFIDVPTSGENDFADLRSRRTRVLPPQSQTGTMC